MSESGFLRRWAQRKAQVAANPQQKLSDSDVAPRQAPPASHALSTSHLQPTSSAPDVALPTARASSPHAQPGHGQPSVESGIGAAPTDEPPAGGAAPSEAEPLPRLDTLTPADDFSPFMRAGIDSGTRNAALRKLFSDPHFNVMDRLDIYIDDYSKPDPIPATMLRALRHARTLGLVDDEPASSAPLDTASDQPSSDEAAQRDTSVVSDDTEAGGACASAQPDLVDESEDRENPDQQSAGKVVGREPSV